MVTSDAMQAGPGQDQSDDSVEVARRFVPTPERVSQFLERDAEEVVAQLASVEGREDVYQQLLEEEEALREIYPSFDPEELRQSLDLVGETLRQKQLFLEDMTNPEKKGMFRRAWDKMKGFAKKHPVVMTVLAVALAAGGVAGTLYAAGGIESALLSVGLSAETAASTAAAAGEVLEAASEGAAGAAERMPDAFNL